MGADISSLGLTLSPGGGTIRVFSRHAERLFFCLIAQQGREVELSRDGDFFKGFIPDLKLGQAYGLRAEGPYDPARGLLFDRSKLLLDPYARAVTQAFHWHEELAQFGAETAALVPHGIVTAPLSPAKRQLKSQPPHFIYEIAVKSFTKRHPAIPQAQRGTVAALSHPALIEHLLKLGVDTVELMPLMAWADERHLAAHALRNSWGYNPYSFFAPDPRLAPGGMAEIQQTVATLQAAGLRVILDVVYNHTGESDLTGPTLSFRGLDNLSYYAHANGQLINDTGCGNTLATNTPLVTELIIASLRYWAEVGGFDGFRYDLATVLGRRPQGFDPDAPLFQAINADPLLSQLIHIAEPWDIGPGGYQLGNFPAPWREWNDRYRDDVRRYWRGDPGMIGAFITRLAGSADIFQARGRPPSCGVNYISAHDGFTLRDTVTCAQKNNFANGEENRDGNPHEPSWVAEDSSRDAKALLSTLFLSKGLIMLTAGDEFGRSQQGNNNAYAQDNELTWLDWQQADLTLSDNVAQLTKLRRDHPSFFADSYFNGRPTDGRNLPDVLWIDRRGSPIDWRQPDGTLFGMLMASATEASRLLAIFNRSGQALAFTAPAPQTGYRWRALRASDDLTACAGRSVSLFTEELIPIQTKQKPDDALIEQLAATAGIQLDWHEVDGTYHKVKPDSLRAILHGLSINSDTTRDAQESLRGLYNRPASQCFYHIKPDQQLSVTLPDDTPRQHLLLESEDGETTPLLAHFGRCQVPALQAGLYHLRSDKATIPPITIAVNEGRAYVPPALGHGERRFGLNAHLYALRDDGDCGIGDFETLARGAETTAQMRGQLIGFNPLHCLFTDDRQRTSPYQPSDRRFIDPIYIDLRQVRQYYGVTTTSTQLAQEALLRAKSHVDYDDVWATKHKTLTQIFAHHDCLRDPEFRKFIRDGGSNLQMHAAYESRFDFSQYDFAMWLQWLADRQLQTAATRATQAGLELGLYRDLALGCAYEGGEVWSQPELYATSLSLGAPPDPFARDGQVWNLPPFNPLALRAADYQPLRDILRANMRHAGILRIDHVLGMARQFWVPRGASGEHGAYLKMPMEQLLALTLHESQKARCVIVGEDLGTVPEGFRETMSDAAIMSYRVLWFEQTPQEFLPPETYPPWSVACLSSHDLLPLKTKVETASADELGRLAAALERTGLATGDLLADAHAYIASSPSALMLIQADDLTEESEPLNVPGTDRERPNWRRRLSKPIEVLNELPTTRRIVPRLEQQGRMS